MTGRPAGSVKRYHAIIVGAGPGGSALAIYLARDGYDVLLLEKDRFPRDKICGDLVSPKGLRYLDDLGCLDTILARDLTPIRGSVVYLDGRELARGSMPHIPGHRPDGRVIPRKELDEIIFRRARESGAETIQECAVTGFQVAENRVTVEAVKGGRKRSFEGSVVIGADGANSVIARAAGLKRDDPRYLMPSIRVYVRGLSLDQPALYYDERFFPGFGWIFPIQDGFCNAGVGMLKEPLIRERINLRSFLERLRQFACDLAGPGRTLRFSRSAGWPIRTYGGATTNVFEGGLLLGDAANFVDPITGEGIPLALESAEIAAGVLRAAFDAGDCSVARLAEYDRRWRARWDLDLKLADLVVSISRNRSLVGLWLQAFRVMGLTARHDRDFALRTGGILAGLMPAREGLSPDIVMKSLIHGPAFWREVFNPTGPPTLMDLFRPGLACLAWQSAGLSGWLRDPQWTTSWASEIAQKQLELTRILARTPPTRTHYLEDDGVPGS